MSTIDDFEDLFPSASAGVDASADVDVGPGVAGPGVVGEGTDDAPELERFRREWKEEVCLG